MYTCRVIREHSIGPLHKVVLKVPYHRRRDSQGPSVTYMNRMRFYLYSSQCKISNLRLLNQRIVKD